MVNFIKEIKMKSFILLKLNLIREFYNEVV